MGAQRTISGTQFTLMLLVSYLTAGIFTFPQELVRSAGPASMVGLATTTVIALTFALLIAWVGRHFPGMTAVEWGDVIIPFRIHRVLATMGALFHVVMAPMQMRVFTEMLKETFFQTTPTWVLVAAILLVAYYGALLGIEAVGRVAVFTLPIMLGTLVVAYLFTIPTMELYRLRPAFTDLPGLLQGCLAAGMLYEGFASIMLLQSKLERPERAVTYVLISFAMSTAIFGLIYLATVASFGQEGIKVLAWPAAQMLMAVRLQGWFTERLGLFVEIVWAGLLVLNTAVHLWAVAIAAVKTLGVKERPWYNWLLAALVVVYMVLAILPVSVEDVEQILMMLPWGGVYLNIVLPLTWLVVGLLRGTFRQVSAKRTKAV